MNKIDNTGKGLARLGRNEDSMLAHVAPGEMVVPPVISPLTQQAIQQEMMAVGLDPNEYTVGQGMSINPITGMAEFGFLKKLGKKLKKVVKKVAPIAIPALGIAGFAGAGPLKGLLGKGAAKATTGKIFGAGGKFRAGLSGFFNPAKDAIGIAGGKLGPNIRRGIGNLFRPGQAIGQTQVPEMQFDESGNPTGLYIDPVTQETYTYEQLLDLGAIDESGNVKGSALSNLNMGVGQRTGPFGLPFGPFLKDTFLGTQEQPGLLSGLGQQQGSMPGGAAGLAALAALYGATVKKQAEKREGGLRDIRASRRPDLAAQPVFQGFDLGVRPGMAYGGTSEGRPGFANGGALNPELFELDYRQVGGPTIGIGTGTSDDIPAMLSDGEYVFTASANNGAGAFDISKSKDSIMLTPDGKPNREKGAKNLGMLMDMFEDTDKRLS
tara:strand:- start:3057 stop:4367 length:1311 start_codon:yes stop_codon:yes gene_type:complete